MLDDLTMQAVHSALRGLSARQRQTADNIANVETPGFLAGRVDFESSLADAISGGDLGSEGSPITQSRSYETMRLDGNNVQLDEELMSLSDTELRYQTMVQAMQHKFRVLKTAIGGI